MVFLNYLVMTDCFDEKRKCQKWLCVAAELWYLRAQRQRRPKEPSTNWAHKQEIWLSAIAEASYGNIDMIKATIKHSNVNYLDSLKKF